MDISDYTGSLERERNGGTLLFILATYAHRQISQLSGQLDSTVWNEILESKESMAVNNPELATKADSTLQEIRYRSISIDTLHSREELDTAMINRVMERFSHSRLSSGARVSIPYILLDCEDSVSEKILSEYTEDTGKHYLEQMEQLQKQKEEDEEARDRIEKTRDIHRSLFMRHLHLEVS